VVVHINDDARRGIERAIAAIAAAVHLRARAQAQERRNKHLKNYSFHSFPFVKLGEQTDYAPLGGVWQEETTA
jgi:hypothetical protein